MTASASMPRTLTGVVVSNKMNKGIVVHSVTRRKHPRFGKFIQKTIRVHAHDENNECKEGDTVTVRECRPMSKTKSWTLDSIKERGEKI